ncbi:MAG: hypothetical protein AAGG44_17015, partial [Planctomycetota bacterium]
MDRTSFPWLEQRSMPHPIFSMAFFAFACVCLPGCSPRIVAPTGAAVATRNQLLLGNQESFPIQRCVLWVHITEVEGVWRSGWRIEVSAKERQFISTTDDTPIAVQPVLAAYALPININSWRSLDGMRITPDGSSQLGRVRRERQNYSLRTTTSNEVCSANDIRINYLDSNRFHLHWTGNATLHGVEGNSFELDAIASFTGVTISGESETDSGMSREQAARIVQSLFPNDQLEQISFEVDRFQLESGAPEDQITS